MNITKQWLQFLLTLVLICSFLLNHVSVAAPAFALSSTLLGTDNVGSPVV